MTCKEFAELDDRARASFTMCKYRKMGMVSEPNDEVRWWNDIRWDHVLSNCRKALNLVETKKTAGAPAFLDVCQMKKEEVEDAVIGRETIVRFGDEEFTCSEILDFWKYKRQQVMSCYYQKPEKQWVFGSGWGRWYDARGTLIYSKCLSLK